jgi:Rrf2 family protein
MKVNTRVRYGLRAILQIAEGYGGDPVPLSRISRSQEISAKYLEQIMGSLRKANLVVSRRGARGGYSLTSPPGEVTLWDVMTALDPHSKMVDCVANPETCDRSDDCTSRTIWSLLSDRMCSFWSALTLEDLAGMVGDAQSDAQSSLTKVSII